MRHKNEKKGKKKKEGKFDRTRDTVWNVNAKGEEEEEKKFGGKKHNKNIRYILIKTINPKISKIILSVIPVYILQRIYACIPVIILFVKLSDDVCNVSDKTRFESSYMLRTCVWGTAQLGTRLIKQIWMNIESVLHEKLMNEYTEYRILH